MEKDKDCCCWRDGSACIHLCCFIWEMVIRLVGSTTNIRRISVSQSGWQKQTHEQGVKITAQPQVTAKKPSQQQCMMSVKTGIKGFWAADAWSDYQVFKTAQEVSTHISQKQYITTGNEAVLDTCRFQVALHLVGGLVLSGCRFNDVTST